MNNHEGDWESVMIFLDKETEAPLYVAYSAHLNDGDPDLDATQYDSVRRNWSGTEVEKEGDQVKSYVALGSHANYPNNGDEGVHHVSKINKDRTSILGVDISHNNWIKSPEIKDSSPDWVYKYEGKWGADALDVIIKESGPQGPSFFDLTGNIRFHEPIKWAGVDDIGVKEVLISTDTLVFISQSTAMIFDEPLVPGTKASVDFHDEFISFGTDTDSFTLLSGFWDIESSMEEDTFTTTVTFDYDPTDLRAFDIIESDLSVFLYDEQSGSWSTVPTLLDVEKKKISFTTTHFSRYALGAMNYESISDQVISRKNWGKYDPKVGTREAEIRIENISENSISDPLRIIVNISDKNVFVLNNTATTTDGVPFIDVTQDKYVGKCFLDKQHDHTESRIEKCINTNLEPHQKSKKMKIIFGSISFINQHNKIGDKKSNINKFDFEIDVQKINQ